MNFSTKSLRNIAVLSALVGASAAFAAGPAAGEFSAADQIETALSQGLTRATVRIEAANDAQAAHKLNGETLQAGQAVDTKLTRAEVREQGRLAMSAGKVATGNISF